MHCILSGGTHSMHFWITWFPFWSRTQRITFPSSSDTNCVCWSTSTTSNAWYNTQNALYQAKCNLQLKDHKMTTAHNLSMHKVMCTSGTEKLSTTGKPKTQHFCHFSALDSIKYFRSHAVGGNKVICKYLLNNSATIHLEAEYQNMSHQLICQIPPLLRHAMLKKLNKKHILRSVSSSLDWSQPQISDSGFQSPH